MSANEGQCCGGKCSFAGCCTNAISKAIAIVKSPKEIWPSLKSETTSIREIYCCYLGVLAAIPAIVGFIHNTFIGVHIPLTNVTFRYPFFHSVVVTVIQYALTLGGAYVMAMILKTLAPKFDGNPSLEDCFKLVAYASAPAYLASVFNLISLLSVVSLAGGIYSIYLFFQGVELMTGVPAGKKLPYSGAAMLVGFVVGLVAMAVVGWFMPQPPEADMSNVKISLPGGESIDVSKMQESLKKLEEIQKSLPQSPN